MKSLVLWRQLLCTELLLLSVILQAINQLAFAKSDNKYPSNIRVTDFKFREKPKLSLVPAAGNCAHI